MFIPLEGEIMINDEGWRTIQLTVLAKILDRLPHDCRLGTNAMGNMTIVDASGDYVGYVDLKREEMHLLDELVK